MSISTEFDMLFWPISPNKPILHWVLAHNYNIFYRSQRNLAQNKKRRQPFDCRLVNSLGLEWQSHREDTDKRNEVSNQINILATRNQTAQRDSGGEADFVGYSRWESRSHRL